MYAELFRHVLFPAVRDAHRQGNASFPRRISPDPVARRRNHRSCSTRQAEQLIEFCWREDPYLDKRWRKSGLRPRPLGSVRELKTFPILTKDEITAN